MKCDYFTFGEVMGFDSTYKVNAYKKPLVVFIGVNHHFKTTIFGFGLLADETESTYCWILESFLESMEGKRPHSVITDSDAAIIQAVKQVLPEATHRLCFWHLAKNAKDNLKGDNQAAEFLKIMKKKQTTQQFQQRWDTFKIGNHFTETGLRFIAKMDDRIEMWPEAYMRGKFFGRMKANQRCESMNSYLKNFIECRLKLFEFVRQIDRAVRRVRFVETVDDFRDFDGTPALSTHLKQLEAHAAKVFTKKAFFMVRDEIRKEISLNVMGSPDVYSDHCVYKLKKYQRLNQTWTVKFWVANGHITCSCLGFESDGIPCRHAFTVMKNENLTEIPPSLIINRWRKKAEGDIVPTRVTNQMDKEGEISRHGSISAASTRMFYLGTKYISCYPVLMREISKVTVMLEEIALKEQQQTHTAYEAPQHQPTVQVKDPIVVRTKGCGTNKAKSKLVGTSKTCRYCGVKRHNQRNCPQKKMDELGTRIAERGEAKHMLNSQMGLSQTGGLPQSQLNSENQSTEVGGNSTAFNDEPIQNWLGLGVGTTSFGDFF